MASIDRVRPPAREGYQPPSLPPKPNVPAVADRRSRSPPRRRDVPPAVPTPPSHGLRNSPPRPLSRRSMPSPRGPVTPRTPSSRPPPSQWFFTTDETLSTPSILDGLPPAEERLRRAKGVNFIYQAGVLLDLPQITLWVAGVFFHRLYMRCSMVEDKGGIHHYNIAATALFLANKTEENCRKTKDLIIAVAKVAQKNTKLVIDEQSKEYWRWRDNILMFEELMLELLTFDLMVDNPYQRLYDHLGQLGILHNKRIREAAWAFCSDGCLTTLPLLMEARDTAVSAIFFASTCTGEKIDDVGGEPWWRFLKGDEDRVAKAVDVMTEFYNENPLRKQDSRYQGGSPEFNLENTRRRGEPFPDAPSSQIGTPTDDADVVVGSQSPAVVPTNNGNGRARKGSEEEPVPDMGRGDSDAVLKVVANDMDLHVGKPTNGHSLLLLTPGGTKRKSVVDYMGRGPADGADHKQKRARLSEEDEGEAH